MPMPSPTRLFLLGITATAWCLLSKCADAQLVQRTEPYVYESWHKTIGVGGPVETVFDAAGDFTTGLQALLRAVERSQGKQLRAVGSRWSVGPIPYTNETLVFTDGLDHVQIGLNESHVAAAYQAKKNLLVFAQTGVRIQSLNLLLQDAGLALITSGSSDGQRLGGAISTGTHGSSKYFGPMQEFVRGIHLVVSPTRHIFLQRASDPAVTASFTTEVLSNATLISDDDLFNAAVVCFGSCGLIHGLLIETEPLYRLRYHAKQMTYTEALPILVEQDTMASFGISQPFHITMGVNPFRAGM
jgi:FAD binding domain